MKKIVLILLVFSFINLECQTIDSIRISNGGVITTLDTIYLHVYAVDGEGGTVSGTNYSLSGLTVNATVNICSGGLNIASYIDALIKINPLSVGSYKIKVGLKNYDNFIHPGCTFLKASNYDSLDINVAEPNAIEEKSNAVNLIYIMPNPFKNSINLKFPTMTECKLSILDNIGRLVYEKNRYNSNQEIDLSFLSTGIYYLKVQSGAEQKNFKIIKD